MGKNRILVVEDDPDIGKLLQTFFDSKGFEVSVATRGEEALSLTRHSLPQLIVLDIMLPDMDGYEICRKLRSSSRTGHIPILFLTQRDERRDRIAGLELGADDYITKPFDIEELGLRVKNAIARAEQDNLTDPRTGLPTSRQIESRLREILPKKGWAIINCRLEGFTAYCTVYGDASGDDFLRFASDLILETVDELGNPEDFIGHPGGDSFIILTEESRTAPLEARLKTRFKQSIPGRYSYLDQQRGYILIRSAAGAESRAPLAQLSVTVVHSSSHEFSDIRQITEFIALAGRTNT
jgi:PleD family two-component response regulator